MNKWHNFRLLDIQISFTGSHGDGGSSDGSCILLLKTWGRCIHLLSRAWLILIILCWVGSVLLGERKPLVLNSQNAFSLIRVYQSMLLSTAVWCNRLWAIKGIIFHAGACPHSPVIRKKEKHNKRLMENTVMEGKLANNEAHKRQLLGRTQ